MLDIRHCDNMDLMRELKDSSINCIITDPPYGYLKNQKLEKKFDEKKFFLECKRIIGDGFLVIFGRGESFYRWNYLLSTLGFEFKEEIVWDKSYTTSSMHPISRCHELVCIYSLGRSINTNVRVDYLEQKRGDLSSILQDVKRIKSGLNNPKELFAMEKYLSDRIVDFGENKKRGFNVTIQGESKEQHRGVKTLQAISEGMKEKSIIKIKRDHYDTIHPTQKPVRLLERLINLVYSKGGIILDPFCGSGSTGLACYNLNIDCILCEIDKDYYEAAMKRINAHVAQQKLFV